MNTKHNITKKEAVRRALAKFGKDAKPAQMQPWIKSEFGIDMTPEHITTSKGEILRKGKPTAKAAAPQPPPAAPETQAKANGISKMEAVRRALRKLGKHAKPSQIQPWIKSAFGIEMSPDHISAYKGKIRSKGKPAVAPAAAKATAPAAGAAPEPAAPKPQPAPAARPGVSLQDLGAVKHLVGRVGADQLRTLIDLFAR